MGLRTKFNIVYLFVFSLGFALSGVLLNDVVHEHALDEVTQEARVMMGSASAISDYTVSEVRPLLVGQMDRRFLPQAVSSYAAQQHFKNLRTQFPDYSYREIALNPTNLNDRPTPWETEIVHWFRNNPMQGEFVFERQTPVGQVLTLARPIQITDVGCLICHGSIHDAPSTMTSIYGTANGFGWKIQEIVGAQIVSVAMSVPLKRAEHEFFMFMIALSAAFVVVIVLINILLHVFVIKPVVKISEIASQVSVGKFETPEYVKKGGDEIASLSVSFNRMRRSLEKAIELLEK